MCGNGVTVEERKRLKEKLAGLNTDQCVALYHAIQGLKVSLVPSRPESPPKKSSAA